MLSKLEFYSSSLPNHDRPCVDASIVEALTRRFRSSDPAARVTPVDGGTLGVCFLLQQHDATRFVKTHAADSAARTRLKSEAEIMLQAYGQSIVLETFEIKQASAVSHNFIVMPELAKLKAAMSDMAARELASDYRQRLTDFIPPSLAPESDAELLLAYGEKAIGRLLAEQLISAATAEQVEQALDLFRDAIGSLPRVLCHGDLGPQNILMQGDSAVAIDWEDAFWGVDGYDYLYWLTFMSNHGYLKTSAYGWTGLDLDVERATLVLIVLLKSYLSVLSGAYRNHATPIEARISEVLTLPLRKNA